MEQRRHSRFTSVENTVSNSPRVPRAKFLGIDGFFGVISICKFGSFKDPFATDTSLSSLSELQIQRIYSVGTNKKSDFYELWQQHKQLEPWRWVRLELIFTMRDTYISSNLNLLTNFTSGSRKTEFNDILQWNIFQIITKTVPVSRRIIISYAIKRGIPFWLWRKVNGNWHNNMIRISQWKKAIVEQILLSEEKKKSKGTGLWKSQSWIRVATLTNWWRSFETEKL